MLSIRLQKTLFHMSSVLTTWFPRGGAWLLDTTLPPLFGHKWLVKYFFDRNVATVRQVERLRRILVISDIHIGDAVMMQAAVAAFRGFLPEARIDYVIKKGVECLIEGNPDISNLYPFFTSKLFPNAGDIESVQKLVVENQYDLCFNTSPGFEDGHLFPKGQKILNLTTVGPQLLRNDIDHTGINHFLFQCHEFIRKILSEVMTPPPMPPFKGVTVTLSDDAVSTARRFLSAHTVPGSCPLIFFNPDTASPYTLIPFGAQLALLRNLLRLPGHVLLGSGFREKDVEKRLSGQLSPEERRKITIVPTSLALDEYTALLDFADVFISGDTGPLHMAAARKTSRSGAFTFRNRTFLASVFGATPARMSGYDSEDPLFPAANQDAPSRTYVSESPCRNITCLNKMAKTCQIVRCFEVLDVDAIAADVERHLRGLAAPSA